MKKQILFGLFAVSLSATVMATTTAVTANKNNQLTPLAQSFTLCSRNISCPGGVGPSMTNTFKNPKKYVNCWGWKSAVGNQLETAAFVLSSGKNNEHSYSYSGNQVYPKNKARVMQVLLVNKSYTVKLVNIMQSPSISISFQCWTTNRAIK